jgi:phosphatidylserine decarboxylase
MSIQKIDYLKPVKWFENLVNNRPQLKSALKTAIDDAALIEIVDIQQYFTFLTEMVTLIPNDTNVNEYMNQFYYILNKVVDNLGDNKALTQELRNWSHEFTISWGTFLDHPESAEYLETLYTDPIYKIDDYVPPPSGWLTFNQFFAREIRPGKRPIDKPNDHSVIVSPADSIFKGIWEITDDAEVIVKGIKHSVVKLLDVDNIDNQMESSMDQKAIEDLKKRFAGGLFTHSFLNTNDYHRFHVPVAGKLKHVWNIHGNVFLNVYKNEDGSLGSDKDKLGWQFNQQRGLIVIETGEKKGTGEKAGAGIGYVAVLPVGMCEISSVVLTPIEGDTLVKGEEFGYFAFGGSDMIMMFEKGKVKKSDFITKKGKPVEEGKHYKQGEQVVKVGNKS